MPWGNSENNDKKNSGERPELKSSVNKRSPWDNNNDSEIPKGDFSQFFKKGEGQFKNLFLNNGPGYNKSLYILLACIVTIWVLSGFYVIDEGEQAVVIRFGKYERTSHTGLNYHFPDPIEQIIIEKVELIRKEEIGFRGSPPTIQPVNSRFLSSNNIKTIPNESHVLTGDENILDINYVVQWRISDLKDYIFNVHNVQETVRNASESALREIVGNNKMVKTLTEGRSSVEQESRILAQKTLDLYKSGVEITTLQMLKVDPPVEVIDAFRDVQTAKADKESEINQAQAYRNDIIPRAEGLAARMLEDGEGYKQDVTERAKGDVSRFNSVYEQYSRAKEVTKNRLYLDTMGEILEGTDKVIIDSSKGSANVLPYLPLPQFNNSKSEKNHE